MITYKSKTYYGKPYVPLNVMNLLTQYMQSIIMIAI